MATKGKGSGFERAICKFLSDWWSEGKHQDLFMRNSTKSSRFSKKGKHQLGDLTTKHTEGIPLIETFSIECKTGYSKTRSGKVIKNKQWDLLETIDGKEAVPTILKFWRQCWRDAKRADKLPLLIFKRDYYEPVVCINHEVWDELISFIDFDYPRATLTYDSRIGNQLLYFFNCKTFFEYVKPEQIKTLHEMRTVEPF